MTPLDTAFKKWLEDDKNTKLEFDYYDTFLNSTIYVPVHEMPEKKGMKVIDEDMPISPVILQDDGKNFVILFDSEERLNKWVGDEDMGYACMDGFEILELFGAEAHFLLNVESDYAKEFSPEEIEWLISNITEE